MADLTPNPELLRSLGRLARGLSCLFWGLPITLLVTAPSVQAQWLGHVGWFPPVAATALLLFGIWQLGSFQRQERVWAAAHGRAQFVALLNLGLSPFLYWFNQSPQVAYFQYAALMFHLCVLLFLALVNTLIERLGAMLPDETLRTETRFFASVNRWLVLLLLGAAILYHLGKRSAMAGRTVPMLLQIIAENPHYFILPFVLVAMALTMALLWKTKEVILESVFSGVP